MRYGIAFFEGSKPTIKEFKNADNLKSFALIFLKGKLREEGFKLNINGLTAYLESWLEWDGEMADENDREAATKFSQVIDTAADTLTYSNVHLQKLVGNVWEPLTSEDKREFFQAIYDKLDTVPEKV